MKLKQSEKPLVRDLTRDEVSVLLAAAEDHKILKLFSEAYREGFIDGIKTEAVTSEDLVAEYKRYLDQAIEVKLVIAVTSYRNIIDH